MKLDVVQGDREPLMCGYDERGLSTGSACRHGQCDAQARARAPARPTASQPCKAPRKAGQASSKRLRTRSNPSTTTSFSLVHQCFTPKAQFNIITIIRIVQCSMLYRRRLRRGGWGSGKKKMQVLSTLTKQPPKRTPHHKTPIKNPPMVPDGVQDRRSGWYYLPSVARMAPFGAALS